MEIVANVENKAKLVKDQAERQRQKLKGLTKNFNKQDRSEVADEYDMFKEVTEGVP